MSFKSLDAASKDPGLVNRTIACTQQEARENPAVSSTAYAATVIENPAEGVQLIWPVALNTEAEYASALAAGIPNPGSDESVITDGMILAAVQASWPPD
ncbi:MAG: hypothetical protein ABW122_05065 [Ilumatobacteraceae bacterium]